MTRKRRNGFVLKYEITLFLIYLLYIKEEYQKNGNPEKIIKQKG